MDIGTIVIIAVVIIIVAISVYNKSPTFRRKADKYVDRDGDGKPLL